MQNEKTIAVESAEYNPNEGFYKDVNSIKYIVNGCSKTYIKSLFEYVLRESEDKAIFFEELERVKH